MSNEPGVIIERYANSESVIQANSGKVVPVIRYIVYLGHERCTMPYGYAAFEARARRVDGKLVLEESKDGAKINYENDTRRFRVIGVKDNLKEADAALQTPIWFAAKELRHSV